MLSVADSSSEKPAIHISELDYNRIADMALRMEAKNPGLAKLILDEIDRAEVYPVDQLPDDVVAIGSEVEFLDKSNDQKRRVTLVVPKDADLEAGRISVLTQVGAGLIGMRAGSEIDWPHPDGRPRKIEILQVYRA